MVFFDEDCSVALILLAIKLDVKLMNKKKKGNEAAKAADAKAGASDKKGSSWNSKGKAEPAKGKKK